VNDNVSVNSGLTDDETLEINQMVISLREQFYILADDDRFRVICGDGADYVADTTDSPEVLLVDGFDIRRQPSQLCSQKFYDDCYRALGLEGLLVVNLCSHKDQQLIARIRMSFDDRVLVVILKMGKTRGKPCTKRNTRCRAVLKSGIVLQGCLAAFNPGIRRAVCTQIPDRN
jgi:hypothetical protein